MIFMLSSLLIIFTTILLSLSHPLAMGMMILILAMLICLISGTLIKTYWFSYILFLIFLGGMLILFIYISSIASNEMFNLSVKNMMLFFLLLIMISTILMMSSKKMLMNNVMMNKEMELIYNNFIFFNNENKMNLLKLYNNQIQILTTMLFIYLLISLIVMVYIMNSIFGSLRTL